MSCAVAVIGTSGRVMTSQTVQVTQQETTIILLGNTSTAIFTTTICNDGPVVCVCVCVYAVVLQPRAIST